MLNCEDMFELVDGEREETKTLWCIFGGRIETVTNVQAYKTLKLNYKSGSVPKFWIVSTDLGETALGGNVYDNLEECLGDFKDIQEGKLKLL